MRHKPITTQEQFEVVAYRIEQLVGAAPASREASELRPLTGLIIEFATRKPLDSLEQSKKI